MVATSAEPDIDRLSVWHAALMRRAEELRTEIREKQTALTQVEERLTLVAKLIEVETRADGGGASRDGQATADTPATPSDTTVRTSTFDLENAVEEILRAAGKPRHISNIHETLVAQGVPIPGRGDDANIIVRLRRYGDRFTRTARGTYGLAEWGIPELASKTRKRRRSAAR